MFDPFDSAVIEMPSEFHGPMEMTLGREGVDTSPLEDARQLVRVVVDDPMISDARACDVVRDLVSVERVVPEYATRLPGGVRVPESRPTAVGIERVWWEIAPELRLVCDKSGAWIAVDPFRKSVELDDANAWRFATALMGLRAWRRHESLAVAEVQRDLRLKLLTSMVVAADQELRPPAGSMFEWDAMARVGPLGTVDGQRRFVVRGGRIEGAPWEEPGDSVQIAFDGNSVGPRGADALAWLLARSGVVPEGRPVDERFGVDVPAMEPTAIGDGSVWWSISEQLWVVQSGKWGLQLVMANPAAASAVVLCPSEGWTLMRALGSAGLWMSILAEEDAEQIAERRRVLRGA